MAITIDDQPYAWAVRGQKLMIIATSTETAQSGFRYGIEVVIESKTYNFYLSPAPDNRLYFDINPLVDDMRNVLGPDAHYVTDDTVDDNSKLDVNFTLTEWWDVAGVFTLNEGSEVVGDAIIVINGYFQVIDAYKPNVQTGTNNVKYSLTSTSSRPMSDRVEGMVNNLLASTWGFGPTANAVWIPVLETDYGLLSIPGNDTYLTNNTVDTYKIAIYSSVGAPTTATLNLNGYDIEGLPVYPANLNDYAVLAVKPSLFPNWRCYTVTVFNGATQKSEPFIFYNAGVYGQHDCKYYNMR